MKRLSHLGLFFLLSSLSGCNGQKKTNAATTPKKTNSKILVGGGCDGCKIMYVGMPTNIESVDTSIG